MFFELRIIVLLLGPDFGFLEDKNFHGVILDIDPRFLNGMIAKTAILGLVASLLFGFFLDPTFGLGVFAGAAVTVINLRFFMFVVEKLLNPAKNEDKSQSFWSILLGTKMLFMIVTVWFLIGFVGLSALGLMFGFSLFLPSMVWQLIAGP